MALAEQIQNDTKAALLGGDRFVGDTLRGLKAAILNEEVAKGKRDEGLSDGEIEQIVAREVKKRHESVKLYEANGRPELAEPEKKEIAVLEQYLPAQLSEAELIAIIDDQIAALGADMSKMGQVIGAVKANVGTSADGATVASLVKQQLSK